MAELQDAAHRIPLTRQRVLAAAVRIADEGGLKALTMRRVATELGVEAMSLYHHVDNKEALLDGVCEVCVEEILAEAADLPLPAEPDGWQDAMRDRIMTARRVMLRHPWAPTVFESRKSIGFSIIRWFEHLLAIMRAGGFSYDLAHHSMHALGSRAIGFSGELFQPDDGETDDESMAMLEQMGEQIPHMVAMLSGALHTDPADQTIGFCDDQTEFEFGVDIILDGLDRRRRDALTAEG